MVVIEMREAAYNKAFDLMDEIKDLGRKKKMALCELEDTLYDCFESSKEDGEYEPSDEYDDDTEMEYRGRRGYRRSAMRSAMHREHDMDDEMRPDMRSYHSMRMRRRDRMGRFV